MSPSRASLLPLSSLSAARRALLPLSVWSACALLSACESPTPKALPFAGVEAGAQAGAEAGDQLTGGAGGLSGGVMGGGTEGGSVVTHAPLSCVEGLTRGGALEPALTRQQLSEGDALLTRNARGVQGAARLWRVKGLSEAERVIQRQSVLNKLSAEGEVRVVLHNLKRALDEAPYELNLTPLSPLGEGLWLVHLSTPQGASSTPSLSAWLEGQTLWALTARDVVESRFQRRAKLTQAQGSTQNEATAQGPLMWGRLTLWGQDISEAQGALDQPAFQPLRVALKEGARARQESPYTPHATTAQLTPPASLKPYGGARWTSPPAQLPYALWQTLAAHPRVVWVGEPMPRPSLLNEPSRSLTNAEVVQGLQRPVGERPVYTGYTGRGVRAAIMDSGVASHPDFFKINERGQLTTERARGALPPSGEGHGTIVAGILGGSGWLSARSRDFVGRPGEPLQWRGQAPEVDQLISYLMMGEQGADERPPWVQAFEEPEEEAPAHLINHSHTFGNGYYGPENQGYDDFTASIKSSEGNPEGSASDSTKGALPRPAVFAAGNNGFSQQADLLILRGYYGLMVNFKNLLVVGALESNDAQHADFSSLGPTLDGRLKPDLAAPGSSDARPLDGFSIQVGEVRLHAREGSEARDRVWYWSEPSGWSGEGGLNPNDEQRPASVEAGVLSGFTFGNSWQTRLGWEASEADEPIDPRLYDQLSFEVRFEVPEQPSALTTPTDRPPLPLSYNLPEAFFVGWADDEGQRLDDFNYFAYGELTEGEWRRVRVPLGGESWAGEDIKAIHRLMITPGLYISGVYTPSIDGGYTISSGTSMASPAAAGVLALTLEQLAAQGRYELEKRPPSPATTRALLNHTARDLTRDTPPGRAYPNPDTGVASRYSEGPDWNTGYGLIDAWAARRLIEADAEAPRWVEGEVAPGEVLRLPLELSEGGELTVSLAWDDPAAALLLEQWAPHLVRDLDLAVVGPLSASGEPINSTKAYGPWVLTPPPLHSERYTSGEDEFTAPFVLPAARCERPSLETLWSGEPREGFEPAPLEVDEDGFVPRLNRGCVDELNTYEQVRFSVPSAGLYELVVRGAPVSGEPLEGEAQRFTLVWSQSCALDPSK